MLEGAVPEPVPAVADVCAVAIRCGCCNLLALPPSVLAGGCVAPVARDTAVGESDEAASLTVAGRGGPCLPAAPWTWLDAEPCAPPPSCARSLCCRVRSPKNRGARATETAVVARAAPEEPAATSPPLTCCPCAAAAADTLSRSAADTICAARSASKRAESCGKKQQQQQEARMGHRKRANSRCEATHI
jgi:hypothetical protein